MSTLSSPIEIEEEIYFYDTDCGGVVHNLAYLRLVEKARSILFRERLGFDAKKMNETQVFPAVVRTEADYLKSAKLGDQLVIQAHFESIERLCITCHFTISLLSAPDKPLMKCIQTTILVQMPSGKPKRVPQEWIATT